MPHTAAESANQRMVDRLIAEGALWSQAVIGAFRETPRHRFLKRVFVFHHRHEGWREIETAEPGAEEIDLLYSDRALITRLAQTATGQQVAVSSSSQPSLMAEMLQDLGPEAGQQVLEIGAGTGYNAALMAHMVGPGLVHAVDVDREVLVEAREHLAGFAERDVQLHHGDGRNGLPEAAPFDRLMVTAATPDLEPAWLAQMKAGGVLVAPVVLAPGMSFVVRGQVIQGVFQGGLTRGAYFMPLRSEEHAPNDDDYPRPGGALRSLPAPWAGWFDRHRPRLAAGSFLQAISFFGWLRGLHLLHAGSSGGYASFGVGAGDDLCWFSSEDWQVSGGGLELGLDLWHAWLQAGGPWPTEFDLTMSPSAAIQQPGPEYLVRRGPICRQVWKLRERRQRAGWA